MPRPSYGLLAHRGRLIDIIIFQHYSFNSRLSLKLTTPDETFFSRLFRSEISRTGTLSIFDVTEDHSAEYPGRHRIIESNT